MAHGLLAWQGVEVRLQLFRREAVVLRKPAGELLGAFAGYVNLGAVAGREDRRLRRQAAFQLAQGLVQALDVEHHALAHRERRGDMVQSEREQRCGQGRDYTGVFTLASSARSASRSSGLTR